MKSKLSYLSAVAAAAVLGSVSFSDAAALVDFKPVPSSALLPEFALSATAYTATIGSVSANSTDPFNPTNDGGLLIETPLTIGGAINGKLITATGSTQFFDTTLVLSADVTNNAMSFSVPGFGTVLTQPAMNGSFKLYASSTPAVAGTLLLSGTFSTAGISGVQGSNTASFQANAITYDGGVIYAALLASLGSAPTPGSLSISMNDLSVGLGATAVGNGQQVVPFTSNATGLFSTPFIPEPGMASWLGGAALALVARRRAKA